MYSKDTAPSNGKQQRGGGDEAAEEVGSVQRREGETAGFKGQPEAVQYRLGHQVSPPQAKCPPLTAVWLLL